MLVIGDGEQILFTNQFKYHIKDVIAVFQVKKNLFANDLDDAHKNLKSVIKVSEPRDAEPYVTLLHRDAYKLFTSSELPKREKLHLLPDRTQLIYHLLTMEAFLPLRIVIGYYGYSTEYSLRNGFVNKLEEKIQKGEVQGYGPVSFPNLFICGNNSIIKCNGMPYGNPYREEYFYWHLFCSSTGKPMYHLLELIWTRLSYMFEISSEIFGDDFVEAVHPFISCKETKINDTWGWEYNYIELSKEVLNKPLKNAEWKPAEIDEHEFVILSLLLTMESIKLEHNEVLLDYAVKHNLDINKIIESLVRNKLVYIDCGEMRLLIDQLVIFNGKNNKYYAGENKNGEMEYFYKKNI
ncbi:MAG: hypothetical protein JWN78_581 [Bacteroidota bacterium]|nr:hypothetical protein [Bacteroidota bacterium]